MTEREALKALVDKLTAIEADPSFQGILMTEVRWACRSRACGYSWPAKPGQRPERVCPACGDRVSPIVIRRGPDHRGASREFVLIGVGNNAPIVSRMLVLLWQVDATKDALRRRG